MTLRSDSFTREKRTYLHGVCVVARSHDTEGQHHLMLSVFAGRSLRGVAEMPAEMNPFGGR